MTRIDRAPAGRASSLVLTKRNAPTSATSTATTMLNLWAMV
jgi:hypothetical protein